MQGNDWRVRQQELLNPTQVRKERMRANVEAAVERERRAHTPGTFEYRQRELLDSTDSVVASCYCGPKDTKSSKAARILCGLSVASTAIGLCGVIMSIQPSIASAIAYAGTVGCSITPCIGHSGKCCNTESNVQDQSVIMMQPQVSTSVVTVQPGSSMQQTSTCPAVAQVHRK